MSLFYKYMEIKYTMTTEVLIEQELTGVHKIIQVQLNIYQ